MGSGKNSGSHGFPERFNRITWIGNYFLSLGIIVAGVAIGWWEVVAIGLAAGVPGGLVTFVAAVRRWPKLLARNAGGRVGGAAAALAISLLLAVVGGWMGGVWVSVLLVLPVLTAQFFVAREWVARGARRGPIVGTGASM